MHEAKKPVAVDVAFALAALGLWGRTLWWTESQAFSAMTLGMLIVCINAAIVRQRARRGSIKKQNPA
jgi:hypothetical protein